ncbi:hypothetical protein ARTHRO9AX_210225 [Arthrobacter sp. 9AX]|nr:hypothetical protein ARTHRO9AX_210225 [Arthrobacter sp. 9AX]
MGPAGVALLILGLPVLPLAALELAIGHVLSPGGCCGGHEVDPGPRRASIKPGARRRSEGPAETGFGRPSLGIRHPS